MKKLYTNGWAIGTLIAVLWGGICSIVTTVVLVLVTGHIFQIMLVASVGASSISALYIIAIARRNTIRKTQIISSIIYMLSILILSYIKPFGQPLHIYSVTQFVFLVALCLFVILPLVKILTTLHMGSVDRHDFEQAFVRLMFAVGYVVFIVMVAVPFYVMVMTSLKSQQSLLANPLDFSLDIHRGWHIFDSYIELFSVFNFGHYMGISLFISVLTVIVTLAVSIPGAYAIARLRFKGQKTFSASVLLVYLVPMIVLALPIYIVFSIFGLRNSLTGILMIYPVTTIPVALYMLQGYFRSIPAEIEEAGLMDGLTRFQVIIKITLPLSLSAIASVSLYVFMIAWNEFLLAYMLLDDPSKFTLTRGISMLNSSEIPRQHLMAGAVIATIPVLVLFLGLERFMVKGLTAGSVKG